jgi:hypothetical protein
MFAYHVCILSWCAYVPTACGQTHTWVFRWIRLYFILKNPSVL